MDKLEQEKLIQWKDYKFKSKEESSLEPFNMFIKLFKVHQD